MAPRRSVRAAAAAVSLALVLASCAGAKGRNDDVPRPGEKTPARSGEFDG